MRKQEAATGVKSAASIGWFGHGWEVQVNHDYADSFANEVFRDYAAFASLPGDTLKQEDRTKVVHVNGAATDHQPANASFVLKEYHYPPLARLYTWLLPSKAEREFQGLAQCRAWGVPTVEPVACGARRSPAGMVESCFVLTRFEDGVIPLRSWLKAGHVHSETGRAQLAGLLGEVAGHLRMLHERRFFLLTAAAKNILVREREGRLAWRFIDLPYARFLQPRPLARLGQRRDLGAFSGSVAKFTGPEAFEPFFDAYLGDPLGGSDATVRRLAHSGARVHNNETPLKCLRRALRPHKPRASE